MPLAGPSRACLLVVAGLAILLLPGCRPPGSPYSDATLRGRYVGVGIYTPGGPWTRMVVPAQPTPTAAKLSDDQAIIVVVDSVTGELRACGDLSGYCIGTNPWKKMLASSQVAPISLTAHSEDVDKAAAANSATQ